MEQVKQYELYEIEFQAMENALTLFDCAIFQNGEEKITISAFQKSEHTYGVRFMPCTAGVWNYQITAGEIEIFGEVECTEAEKDDHGPVVVNGLHFRYTDGAKYIPFGTTCYAWIHQTEALQDETIETLRHAPFNKIRMCIFPKSMPYNNNDPEHYPFMKREDGTWNLQKPDPVFWENLDRRLTQLSELGVEADLILYHPYDRWGFSVLSQEESLAYLEYCIARLAAYKNVWWSLANEYEMVGEKTMEDWDEYGEMLYAKDPYHHPVSIHNIVTLYPKRRWMTHCSIQSKKIDRIIFWKEEYQIPILIDECGYEGDLPFDWGSLTAEEMVYRFWWTVCRDGFCTHGETFHRDDEVLWWAKGGKLYGESAERIAFLKELMYSLPGEWHAKEPETVDPNQAVTDQKEVIRSIGRRKFLRELKEMPQLDQDIFLANTTPMKLEGDGYTLEYFGRICPVYQDLKLCADRRYQVEVIDSWEMTKKTIAEDVCGNVRIPLPAKEGIAVLVREI